jgi:Fe(3+) dicitrate transport protein
MTKIIGKIALPNPLVWPSGFTFAALFVFSLNKNKMVMRIYLTLVILALVTLTHAQDHVADSLHMERLLEEVTILGSRDGLFGRLPGSLRYLSRTQIQRLSPLSGNEVFRQVPGVHVVDEEGAGLRINIGIRGLDPDRSRGVLILEDGIPVSLAPYGEPEMYYTPAMERMEGVEILKGSGQIQYGPQTIGGVINYITADPPATPQGYLRVRAGEGGLFHGHVGYGATHGNAGYQINYLRKRADRIGYVGYDIHDFNAKFKLRLSNNSAIVAKLSVYDEWSDATYIGLTQTMYDVGGQDFVQMAPDDQLRIRRYGGSIQHRWTPSATLQWKTTAFGYTTTRNWKRQDFTFDPNASNLTGVVWGDMDVPGGAVFMRGSTGNRNRQFEVAGLESRLEQEVMWWGLPQTWSVGARVLYERAFEQRVNGRFLESTSGTMVSDEVRTGYAWSAFAHQQISITSRWSMTAGLRMEHFDFDREILRGVFGGVSVDTLVRATDAITTFIPGIGFNYRLAPDWVLFAGLHRGFAPPRTKDAITAAGETLDLEAEQSWNAELGLRYRLGSFWGFELTAFHMDFSNQIIPVSESSGGTGVGLVNGGATRHYGLEAALTLRIGHLLGAKHTLDITPTATLLRATYAADRFKTVGGEQVNIKGNDTPYAPRLLMHHTLAWAWQERWGLNVILQHTSGQFSDELNTTSASANGRIGRIDGYTVMHTNAWYALSRIPLRVGLSVQNLTDERYIVTRRPQGIRLGLPRFLSGTLEYTF